MSAQTRWWGYVERRLRDLGMNETALLKRANLGGGNTTRWKKGDAPSVASVRAVATVFGDSFREALLESELVTAQELEVPESAVPSDLSGVPNRQLLAELQRRLSTSTGEIRETITRKRLAPPPKTARRAKTTPKPG